MSETRYYECPKHGYGTNVYDFFVKHLENEHESYVKDVTNSERKGDFLKISGLRQGVVEVFWRGKRHDFRVDKYGRIRGIIKGLRLKRGDKLSYIPLRSAIYLEKNSDTRKTGGHKEKLTLGVS